MAIQYLIPRLEWNYITKIGNTTNGSNTITGVSSTSDLSAGMIVSGPGIPLNSTITALTSNTITISSQATATASGISTSIFNRFDFRFPPSKDSDNQLDPQEKVTISLSGKRQVQVDFIEEKRAMTYDFLTEAEYLTLRNSFYVPWAVYGKEFNYYPDQADYLCYTYSLSDFKFSPRRQIKKHPSFLYQLSLTFRRTI